MDPIILSVLDTDLYKLSMGYAVAKRYPRVEARYKFFNRGKTPFPEGFATALSEQIDYMGGLSLTGMEHSYLRTTCGEFLDPQYLDWLRGFRFNPAEVSIEQNGGELSVEIEGPWYRTIFWEVPLMSIISELYFKLIGQPELKETGEKGDFELDLQATSDHAANKAAALSACRLQVCRLWQPSPLQLRRSSRGSSSDAYSYSWLRWYEQRTFGLRVRPQANRYASA